MAFWRHDAFRLRFSSASCWLKRFVSAMTTPDKNKRPIKFGMAIKPLNTSESAHTKFKFVVIAPSPATRTKAMRYGIIDFGPNK